MQCYILTCGPSDNPRRIHAATEAERIGMAYQFVDVEPVIAAMFTRPIAPCKISCFANAADLTTRTDAERMLARRHIFRSFWEECCRYTGKAVDGFINATLCRGLRAAPNDLITYQRTP